MSSTRGAFILFEGIDRCGKTTQSGLLMNHMATKQSTELIRFPDRTSTIGQLINSYLTSSSTNIDDHTIHLLFSANRWEASANLKSKLEAGTNLVSVYMYVYISITITI
jgi:dTMP kinase